MSFYQYLMNELDFVISELENSSVMDLSESGCVERLRELYFTIQFASDFILKRSDFND